MKKVFIIAIGLGLSLSAFSQNLMKNPWSIGINFGSQFGMTPITSSEEVPQVYEPSVFQINAVRMFNDNLGIMAAGNLHFISTDVTENSSSLLNLQLHALWNAGNTFNFESFSDKLGLTMHAGIGGAALWQKDYFETPDSRLIKGADELITLGVGIKPQFAVSECVAINLDYSFNFSLNQSRDFDMVVLNNPETTGQFMTLTLGVSYHFGGKSAE